MDKRILMMLGQLLGNETAQEAVYLYEKVTDLKLVLGEACQKDDNNITIIMEETSSWIKRLSPVDTIYFIVAISCIIGNASAAHSQMLAWFDRCLGCTRNWDRDVLDTAFETAKQRLEGAING